MNKAGREKDQESRSDLKPQTMMLLQLRNVGSVTDVKENVMSLSSSSGECCVNVLQGIESEDWRVGLTGKSSPFPYRGRYTMYRSIPPIQAHSFGAPRIPSTLFLVDVVEYKERQVLMTTRCRRRGEGHVRAQSSYTHVHQVAAVSLHARRRR